MLFKGLRVEFWLATSGCFSDGLHMFQVNWTILTSWGRNII